MKKLLLLLLATCFFYGGAVAQQWEYYKDFPINAGVLDVDSNNEGTLFMLTLDSQLFYKTIDGQWTELPGPYGVNNGLMNGLCLSVVKDSNKIYVGSTYEGLFKSSNFGQSWTKTTITTNPVTGFNESCSELTNITNPNLFFGAAGLGLAPYISKYTNNGNTGQLIAFDPDNNTSSAPVELLYTNNQKLVIGTYNNGIWISEDDGASFSQTAFDSHQVYRFTEGGSGKLYALAYDMEADEISLIQSDDYVTWTTMALPNDTDRYTTIYHDNSSQSLWLGSETAIYRLPDANDAVGWSNASYNNPQQFLIEIIGDNNGGVYNFSSQDIAQKLAVSGDTWSSINDGITGEVNQVRFGANNKLFAVNNYFSNNVSTATDENAPWNNMHLGGQTSGIRHLYTNLGGTIYADTAFRINKSVDNGLTYTDITPTGLSFNYISQFYVGEAGDLFVITSADDELIYWSQDEGQTWSLFADFSSSDPLFPNTIESFVQDASGTVYLTLFSLDIPFGERWVHYTLDGGDTWGHSVFFTDSFWSSALYAKNDKVFIIVDGIYEVDITDTASPFSEVNLPWNQAAEQVPLSNFRVDGANQFYIYGYDLYKSTDFGVSWSNLGHPAAINTAVVEDLLFDGNNIPYLVANHTDLEEEKGIYKLIGNLGVEHPSGTSPITVYPNPADGLLHIHNTENAIEMVVYDAVGKKMLRQMPVQNMVDVSVWADGIYIIKATLSNGEAYTIKFIKN